MNRLYATYPAGPAPEVEPNGEARAAGGHGGPHVDLREPEPRLDAEAGGVHHPPRRTGRSARRAARAGSQCCGSGCTTSPACSGAPSRGVFHREVRADHAVS
jgi:hypothetical protein